jgi:hypothetical protein
MKPCIMKPCMKKLSPLAQGEQDAGLSRERLSAYQRKRMPAVVAQLLSARKPLARPPFIFE